MTSVAEVQLMLSTMLSKVGDGYTESIPQRFGTTTPQLFDCSGLVWYAATNAGIPMPGGPTNDVAALVTNEMVWLSQQSGAQLVLNASDVQAGDIIAFTGGDPVPFIVRIGGIAFPAGEFGHIGMAVDSTTYVSAYDTAEGVCVKPIAGDVFNVAIRLAGGPMTITMYDSTSPAAIPAGAQLVAAYVDGYGGFSAAQSRFGANKVISISVGNNDADVADVETGAMTPIDLPGWVARQVARGVPRPVVYCNQSTWPLCQNALGKTNVSWWIANPGGSGTIAGADAVQNVWEGAWDSSVVQPTFPFYNGTVTPPSPVVPAFPIVAGDSGADVKTVQTRLNVWATPIKLTTKLVVDGDFGSDTLAAVRLALKYFDYSAANVALGQVPESLWTHLLATPPVIKPPAPPPLPPPPAVTTGHVLYMSNGKLVDSIATSTNLKDWTV